VKRILLAIPQREGEHTIEPAQRAVDAPALESRKCDLRVGVTAPPKPIQLMTQAFEVVYLAVERDHVTSRLRAHRLVSLGGEVDDRQTTMSQRHPASRIRPASTVIGPPVLERVCHALYEGSHAFGSNHRRSLDKPSYPAH
jgi:hypothetical protein